MLSSATQVWTDHSAAAGMRRRCATTSLSSYMPLPYDNGGHTTFVQPLFFLGLLAPAIGLFCFLLCRLQIIHTVFVTCFSVAVVDDSARSDRGSSSLRQDGLVPIVQRVVVHGCRHLASAGSLCKRERIYFYLSKSHARKTPVCSSSISSTRPLHSMQVLSGPPQPDCKVRVL